MADFDGRRNTGRWALDHPVLAYAAGATIRRRVRGGLMGAALRIAVRWTTLLVLALAAQAAASDQDLGGVAAISHAVQNMLELSQA